MQRHNTTDGDVAVLDPGAADKAGDGSPPRRPVRRQVDLGPDKKDGRQDDERFHPKLTPQQIEHVERFAVCREFAAGDLLFDQGQRDAPFFLLKSGGVDVFEKKPCEDRQFLTLRAPTFIGDVSIFTGQPTVVGCRAAEPCQALEVSPDGLREIVAQYSDIGDKILGAFMVRRQWLSDNHLGEMQLIGPRNDRKTFELRDFLSRNGLPFDWTDPETDQGTRVLLDKMGIRADQTPVLIAAGNVCRRPTVAQVAEYAGLLPDLGTEPYDVVVVGAGPAGLAATVYGASEGLKTLALDGDSPGGQAGTSSKIENYLGFATGISGAELSRQAVLQARKFAAVLSNPTRVVGLDCGGGAGQMKTLRLDDGRVIEAKSIVIATGAEYRKLEGEGFDRFEMGGVYYAAGFPEATQCKGEDVIVVGGGNSAGQAAVFMSQHVNKVYVVIRGGDLRKGMSEYLVSRIETADNIEVVVDTNCTALDGDGRLQAATLSGPTGDRRVDCSAVFVMIGALPRTDWLAEGDCVGLCPKGFVATGDYARSHEQRKRHWDLDRDPFFLETTRPGIFAVGDVRAGSVKRVASGVGEGSMAIKYVHEYLAS